MSPKQFDPLRIHVMDTLSTILRNAMVRNMRAVVVGITVERSKGQRVYDVSATAYGAALDAWGRIWRDVHQTVSEWAGKLEAADIEVCEGCTLYNIESLFRSVLHEQAADIVVRLLEGEDTFESPSPDAETQEYLHVILDPASHEH